MNKKLVFICTMLLAVFAASSLLQADFIQCPDGGCSGTANSDVINGTPMPDSIDGDDGDDIISGLDGMDSLAGGNNNDTILGGFASDYLDGNDGNDHLLPGPDSANIAQMAYGGSGNDFFYSFASETVFCLFIDGEDGQDTANLGGFGPYSAEQPFGQPGFGSGYLVEMDPIAGGYVLIYVEETGNGATERINGLTTPNPPIIDTSDPIYIACNQSPSSTPV